MLRDAALVFLGGGLGSVTRYLVALLAFRIAGPGFPWGTLAVNLAGCLTIGVVAGLTAHRYAEGLTVAPFAGMAPSARLLVVTGFLGGFTTFSAFGLETIDLLRIGQPGRAATYLLVSVLVGVLLAGVGWSVGVHLAPPAPPLSTGA